jgi:hypothetical protein
MSALLTLLLLLTPVKVEQGRFNIVKDGKRIGTEEFRIAKQGSHYEITGKAAIGELAMSSTMEVDENLAPVSYEVSNREGALRVHVASPISELNTVIAGETASADFRFPEGGVILDNNFFHHYLVLLYRAQAGKTDFGVFVPQDMSIGAATVKKTGPRTFDIEVGDVKMQATTDADGALMKLTVPSANVVVER